MRRLRALRLFAVIALAAVVLTACGGTREDEEELRGFIAASERQARSFDYVEAAQDRWFRAEGAVQDDLRFRVTVHSASGPALDMIIVDDALAIRVADPTAFEEVGVPLGHPALADALLSGNWVLDPAGAPPLTPPQPDPEDRSAPAPDQVVSRLLRTLRFGIGEAQAVREFSLESIEYRPSLDPWEYPSKEEGEVRYDLIRRRLPVREEELQQQGITIGESMFRKTSIFVRDDQIYQVCEMVDVAGHEEFVRLREENKQNEFLDGVQSQVLEGRTVAPVRQRSVYVTFDYPDDVEIALPSDAIEARLDSFKPALAEALVSGLIDPPGPAPVECLRQEDVQGA